VDNRVIVAIKLDCDNDPSWFDGPPYAVAEQVFAEEDFAGCALELTEVERTVS
jgi:hypothetical protein